MADKVGKPAVFFQDKMDKRAKKGQVRIGPDAYVMVGHGRGAGKARVYVDEGCAAFFCFHDPLKTNRMGFRHVGTHDKDAVAVAHVARKVGASAETE